MDDHKPSATKRNSHSTTPSIHSAHISPPNPDATHPSQNREKHPSTSRKNSVTSHADAKAEQIARIDALATAPGVSMASFAHLDEKKILRKMDLRLIPMLALLYLLSFLDRGNIGTLS